MQIDRNGNYLFTTIKKSLGVRHKDERDHPYYPTRYFQCQVVVWLVQNRQHVWFNKHIALEVNYRLDEQTPTFRGPLIYKSYCHHLLQRSFWGDEVVVYAVSAMWGVHITVLNSKTDQEYQIHHNAIMDQADVNLVFNVGMHYSAADALPCHFN